MQVVFFVVNKAGSDVHRQRILTPPIGICISLPTVPFTAESWNICRLCQCTPSKDLTQRWHFVPCWTDRYGAMKSHDTRGAHLGMGGGVEGKHIHFPLYMTNNNFLTRQNKRHAAGRYIWHYNIFRRFEIHKMCNVSAAGLNINNIVQVIKQVAKLQHYIYIIMCFKTRLNPTACT